MQPQVLPAAALAGLCLSLCILHLSNRPCSVVLCATAPIPLHIPILVLFPNSLLPPPPSPIPRALLSITAGVAFGTAQQRLESFSAKMGILQKRITCVRQASVLFNLPPPVFAALRPLAEELALLSSVFGLNTEVLATSDRFWNTLFKVR